MDGNAVHTHAKATREVPARRESRASPADEVLDLPLLADAVLILAWTGCVLYAFAGAVPSLVLLISGVASATSAVLVRRGILALVRVALRMGRTRSRP